MNADGSGPGSGSPTTRRATASPAWSPDGTRIAFKSDRDGNDEIYVMNADGTGQTNLTSNAAVDYSPDWQPLPSEPIIFVHGFVGSKIFCGAQELWPNLRNHVSPR